MIWTGLLVGIVFGVILQRGRICFNSAFRDVLLFKDNYLMRFAALALGLQSVTLLAFAQIGLIKLNPSPLNWVANIIGGYIFGLGMVLAGGCASGVTYRVGEGMTTAWFAALVFALSARATRAGLFVKWTNWLKQFEVTVNNEMPVYAPKTGPTISNLLGISPWIVSIVFLALMLWYAFGVKRKSQRPSKLNWIAAAILIAVLAPIAWWTSAKAGRNYGLGITGGWINLISVLTTSTKLSWDGAEILGIIIGAALSAVLGKEFKLRMPKNPMTYVQVLVGGFLMGFGATTAGGCNIGHFLTGVPLLAVSSIVATVFFILGNWTMAWLLFGREKQQ